MLRGFAVGLGIATIRPVAALLQLVTGSGLVEVIGPALWIAFSLHLAAAEAWIRWTATERPSKETAARRSSMDAATRRTGVG